MSSQHDPGATQLDHHGLAELGATWLHGLVGHPIYELALEHGLMDGTEKRTPSDASGLPL